MISTTVGAVQLSKAGRSGKTSRMKAMASSGAIRSWFVVVLSGLILGCAYSSGPAFVAPRVDSELALVYVYRDSSFAGSMNPFTSTLQLDGQDLGQLKMGGYFPLVLKPGQYTLSLVGPGGKSYGDRPLSVRAGETHFLEYVKFVDEKMVGVTRKQILRESLHVVSREWANKTLERCRLQLLPPYRNRPFSPLASQEH